MLGYRADGTNQPHYVRHRHYLSVLSNWTSVDGLWPEEQSYAYAASSPVFLTDESGFQPQGRPGTGVHGRQPTAYTRLCTVRMSGNIRIRFGCLKSNGDPISTVLDDRFKMKPPAVDPPGIDPCKKCCQPCEYCNFICVNHLHVSTEFRQFIVNRQLRSFTRFHSSVQSKGCPTAGTPGDLAGLLLSLGGMLPWIGPVFDIIDAVRGSLGKPGTGSEWQVGPPIKGGPCSGYFFVRVDLTYNQHLYGCSGYIWSPLPETGPWPETEGGHNKGKLGGSADVWS